MFVRRFMVITRAEESEQGLGGERNLVIRSTSTGLAFYHFGADVGIGDRMPRTIRALMTAQETQRRVRSTFRISRPTTSGESPTFPTSGTTKERRKQPQSAQEMDW